MHPRFLLLSYCCCDTITVQMDASLKKGLLRVKSSGTSLYSFCRTPALKTVSTFWPCLCSDGGHALTHWSSPMQQRYLGFRSGEAVVGCLHLWSACSRQAVRFPFIYLLFREMPSCVAYISKRKPVLLVCPTHQDACVLSVHGAMTAWQSNVVFSEKYF